MLCYLRSPGRMLQQGEQPPDALCGFVAEQLSLDAAQFSNCAERDQTRREQVLEIQTALGLRPFTRTLYRELAAWLLLTALVTDHGPALVAALLAAMCRYLAVSFAKRGITVNAVCAGITDPSIVNQLPQPAQEALLGWLR